MSRAEANGQGERRRSGGFGPFQALATLTEVQRRGMAAAAEVIEGFIGLLDPPPQPPPAGPDVEPANGHEPGFAQVRVNVARALDLYTDLVRRSFESYAELMEQTLRARGVQVHAAEDGQAALLTMQGAAGARAAATVWLHNTTDRPAAAILRLTGLTAHNGLVVPAAAGRFQPTSVRLAPGASVSVRLALALDDVTAGVYRGHVLADGLPDAALPVRLLVTDTARGRPP
jgi:hypothetical protein